MSNDTEKPNVTERIPETVVVTTENEPSSLDVSIKKSVTKNRSSWMPHYYIMKCWDMMVRAIAPPSFWHDKKVVGKNGNEWFVRMPLWFQSTILIFAIGFISLMLLLVITAAQVWSYSLNLMSERLSTSAGMVALSLEQQFSSVGVEMSVIMSHPTVLNFVESANDGIITTEMWIQMDADLTSQIFLSRQVLNCQLYDQNLNPIYTYTQRTSTRVRRGQQNSLLPRDFFSLTTAAGINRTMGYLSNGYPAVMSSVTISSVNDTSASLVFALTFGISRVPTFNEAGYFAAIDNPDWLGYATVVFDLPLSTKNITNSAFPNSWSSVVREQDLMLNTSSPDMGEFSFLFPIHDDPDNPYTTYPVSAMPVVLAASALTGVKTNNDRSSNISRDTNDSNYNVQSRNSETFKARNDFGLTEISSYSGVKARNVSENNITWTNTSATNITNTSATNSSLNPYKGAEPSYVTPSTRQKLTGSNMRTLSPNQKKASIGYSYANIITDQWLVFVEIHQNEAYYATEKLRNKLIGVAVGILGAVLLMVIPLSVWQTRGFYVVYQNMKLRPMFIFEELDLSDEKNSSLPPEGSAISSPLSGQADNCDLKSASIAGVPTNSNLLLNRSIVVNRSRGNSDFASSRTIESSRQKSSFYDYEQGFQETITPHESPNSESNSEDTNSLYQETDNNRAVNSKSLHDYRYAIPLPLPKLNRWYTDETDDLVETYNDMVRRLNGQYFHLEDQVKMRTKEAQQARELREKANAAKSEFIAIITHELRTPLNGIMGLTAVSADESDMNKINEALSLIIDSGHVLMDLLNELLELSKSLIGVDPIITIFTPTKLMETLSQMFVSRVGSLSVNFALAAVPPQLNSLNLRGDLDHIAQVCISFMSNAMKFSPDNGNVSVIIHLRSLNDPYISLEPYEGDLNTANGVLEILVTDSGVGISPQQLGRMFDLFVQGEDPLRKNHKGAGLGMAFSKHLSEGIGGYVTVYSAKDVGSTVVLRVPVEAMDVDNEQVESLNGPPIEFKVSNVYKTMSLHAGDVSPISQSYLKSAVEEPHAEIVQQRSFSRYSGFLPPHNRRSRHRHQSSSGSKMLLTKAYPVTKILNSQFMHGKHEHQRSDGSQKNNSSQSPIRSRTHEIHSSSESSTIMDGSINSDPAMSDSPLPAIFGKRPDRSASSLLLNLPDDLFHTEKRATSPTNSVPTAMDWAPLTDRTEGKTKDRPTSLIIPSRNLNGLHGKADALPNENSVDAAPNSASSERYPSLMLSAASTTPLAPDIRMPTDTRILVADDNRLNLTIMIKMLEQLGIKHVDTATDGDMVVKLVEKSIVAGLQYNLIFMDLSMPGKSGIEATNLIRRTLGYPYPIVALTGFADPETRNACLNANIQEVLTKPILRNDVIRVLQKFKSFV